MLSLQLLIHNSQLEALEEFERLDSHWRMLNRQVYAYRFPLVDQLPKIPGIFTITGERQIGKTTLVKQWTQLLSAATVNYPLLWHLARMAFQHEDLQAIIVTDSQSTEAIRS